MNSIWCYVFLRISIVCVTMFCVTQVSFQQTFEQKRSTHLQELQQKEDEMRQMFVLRVKEKEAELKEAEKEVCLGVYCRPILFLVIWAYHSFWLVSFWHFWLLDLAMNGSCWSSAVQWVTDTNKTTRRKSIVN